MSIPESSTEHRATALVADFRAQTTFGASIGAALLIAPLTVTNFIQGQTATAVGASIVLVVLVMVAISIKRGRYRPKLVVFGLLPPFVVFLSIAYQEQGVVGALWTSPAIIAMYFMFPERWAWFSNLVTLAVLMPQAWQVLEPDLATRSIAVSVIVSLLSFASLRIIAQQQALLKELAVTDSLTGLLNRSVLGTTLTLELKSAARSERPATLMAIDIDHFKEVNDTLGHATGDKVLRDLATLLQRRLRSSDPIFRIGGEEFLVLLPDCDLEAARVVAEELRSAIESAELVPGRTVTASFGLAVAGWEMHWRDWVKRADEQLYKAKQRGRNRIAAQF